MRQYLFYFTLDDHLGVASYGPWPTQKAAMNVARETAKTMKFDTEKGTALLHVQDLKSLVMRTQKITAEELLKEQE